MRFGLVEENSKDKNNSKSWRVEGLHSHLSRDETAAKMGHPCGLGWWRRTARTRTTATAGWGRVYIPTLAAMKPRRRWGTHAVWAGEERQLQQQQQIQLVEANSGAMGGAMREGNSGAPWVVRWVMKRAPSRMWVAGGSSVAVVMKRVRRSSPPKVRLETRLVGRAMRLCSRPSGV